MTKKAKIRSPVKNMDLTLRDGHQSLFATRMRTEDMIPIAEQMENALISEADGTVKAIFFNVGDSVRRGDVLAIIE